LDTFFGRDTEEAPSSKVDLFDIASYAPAKKRSDPPRKDSVPARDGSQTGRTPSTPPKKTGGNITIEQKSYASKDKSVVTSSDFFEIVRKNNQAKQEK